MIKENGKAQRVIALLDRKKLDFLVLLDKVALFLIE